MATDRIDVPRFFDPEAPPLDGIPFGSGAAMISTIPRQRDRRNTVADLLGALTRALDRRHDISLMRGVFEQTLRRVVPVRTVQLREPGSRWGSRPDTASGPESLALEVPGADAPASGLLEATFDPGRLGEWDFQMLAIAAHLGALVLEIERWRLQLARAGLCASQPRRRDGAAPLIGSTPACRRCGRRSSGSPSPISPCCWKGNRGVGKELVARQIHELSRRRQRAIRRHQLRRARRDAARGRAVRHRGADRDRRQGPAREVRACRRRHACSWTKCPICRCPRRPSFCAPFRIWRWSGSAALTPTGSTCGLSPPPTAACWSWSSGGCSVRTSIIG